MYKARQHRSDPADREQDDDPILTPNEMAEIGRMSRTTFQRVWRFDERVVGQLVLLSRRKLGMHRSRWLAILRQGASRKP